MNIFNFGSQLHKGVFSSISSLFFVNPRVNNDFTRLRYITYTSSQPFNTVNPRISPRGLIVNFEILHGDLIEGGGLFEGGGLLKIVYFYMGAKSK